LLRNRSIPGAPPNRAVPPRFPDRLTTHSVTPQPCARPAAIHPHRAEASHQEHHETNPVSLGAGAACRLRHQRLRPRRSARFGNRPTSLPTQIPTTIEGITAAEIARGINATDAEDALKYLPSLLVRKRYIGDYNHAVLSTRASGTGNSARSAVYADGILLSNYLGNGATFAPRWGMVTPRKIERVDVLYGPFSAAYGGNSVGAVVDYVTRMPRRFEAHAKLSLAHQPFSSTTR
jgi:hypothetical protein